MAGLALTLLTSPAFADVAARYETTEEDPFIDMEMTFETDDAGDVRLQMAGQASYYLLSDGEAFVVSRGSTGPTVVLVSDLLTVQSEILQRMGVSDRLGQISDPDPSLEFHETGPETVGLWQGTGYSLGPPTSGSPAHASLVLSEDPRLAPLGQAMAALQKETTSGMGQFTALFAQFGSAYEELLSKGTPVRWLQLELTDISFEPIDPARFALPAPPITIDQLRAESAPLPPPPTLPPRGS
jgi:hypothetical protein